MPNSRGSNKQAKQGKKGGQVKRGFASLSPEERRRVARKGGIASHRAR